MKNITVKYKNTKMKVSKFALKYEIYLVCKNILLSFFQKVFGFRKNINIGDDCFDCGFKNLAVDV